MHGTDSCSPWPNKGQDMQTPVPGKKAEPMFAPAPARDKLKKERLPGYGYWQQPWTMPGLEIPAMEEPEEELPIVDQPVIPVWFRL